MKCVLLFVLVLVGASCTKPETETETRGARQGGEGMRIDIKIDTTTVEYVTVYF